MNFFDKIGDTIAPLARKLGENRYLSVLRDAFMLSFPLTMFGSIVVVLFSMIKPKHFYLIYSVTVKVQPCQL